MASLLRLQRSKAHHGQAGQSPFLVTVEPVEDGWLTLCRDHGWLHATRSAALADASEIAAGFGVGMLIRLGRRA